MNNEPLDDPSSLQLCTRREREALEAYKLAPYACHSAHSAGRDYPEDEADYRTPFQRDRDRIIHCAAFRRMEYKTQVFINTEGDHYRTRLTHSMEVSQIARSLARMLRLNEDLVEAIALAHDLGHTPFGHAGERALDRLTRHQGGFDHNKQAIRVVEKLERRTSRYPGLNLTAETREGIRKHDTWYEDGQGRLWDNVDSKRRWPHLEGQVVDIADELAYHNHDIDDGLFSGLLELEEVLEAAPLVRVFYDNQLERYPQASDRDAQKATVGALINHQVLDVAEHSLRQIERLGIRTPEDARCADGRAIGFSPEMQEHNKQLKTFLFKRLYRHWRVMGEMTKCERMTTELFQLLVGDPRLLRPDIRERSGEDESTERVVADYIAGMTDRFALEEYQRLFIPDISVHSRR